MNKCCRLHVDHANEALKLTQALPGRKQIGGVDKTIVGAISFIPDKDMKLVAGQELWMVPTDERYRIKARFVRVKKVGSKWAELESDEGRVNIKNGWVDRGLDSSPGRCWSSKEAWEAEERRVAAWEELRKIAADFYVPDVPESALRKCIEILSNANTRHQSSHPP